MRTLFQNIQLVQDGSSYPCGVLVEDDHIAAILPLCESPVCERVIDGQGLFLSHGFIDMHTHGGGGHDFMDGTVDAYLGAVELHAKHGTTNLVSTTLASSKEELLQTFSTFEQAKAANRKGAKLIGLHIEGPYLAASQCGAQDPRYIRNPDKAEYQELVEACPHILRWTIAPELDGALEFADYLTAHHILPSIGHSDADYEQVLAAFPHGFHHITHFYSCMSTITRKNGYRHAGVLESGYLIDGMTVEIIADGCHLPQSLLQMVYRFIGADRTALVTDSMRGAGMPQGESILGSLQNGQLVIIEDGVAKLTDRSAFAGSVATADRLVRNMITLAGAPLPSAVQMMTQTPAKILGKSDSMGRIAVGRAADLILFDADIHIKLTMTDGAIIFSNL